MADVGPESTVWKQEAQRDALVIDASPLDVSIEGTAIVGTSADATVYGVGTGVRTHKGTLELAGRIGSKSWRLLIDSGSTGNYISTQVCTDHNLRVEKDPTPDQLTMADGTQTKTAGKVQVKFKCGGYRGSVEAKVFPGLQKPMILGIPWLTKENPHIDWTAGAVVVEKDDEWIQLPLAQKKGSSVDAVTMVSARQMSKMFKKKQVTKAFIGFVRKVEEKADSEKGVSQSDLDSA